LYYDGLLFAGMGYLLAFIWLRLYSDYFFVPVIILALPSIAYWTKYLYNKKKIIALVIVVPVLLISLYNLPSVRNQRSVIMRGRECTMASIESINKEYINNAVLYWYEESNGNDEEKIFYNEWVDWHKEIIIKMLNYINNETTRKDIFVIIKQIDHLDKDGLFFYSKMNNGMKPVPIELEDQLAKFNYTKKEDPFGNGEIVLYRYQPKE
jgi:hypothetical protein